MTTYKDAGVDIDAGNEFVKRLRPIVISTWREGCFKQDWVKGPDGEPWELCSIKDPDAQYIRFSFSRTINFRTRWFKHPKLVIRDFIKRITRRK